MSDEEIFADTKEKVKSLPGYLPRTEWIDQAGRRPARLRRRTGITLIGSRQALLEAPAPARRQGLDA